MNFLAGIFNGLAEIRAHKLRSALTILSVMLGVVALVVVMGMLYGIIEESNASISDFGGMTRLRVFPTELPESQQHLQSRQRPMLALDATVIADQTGDDALVGLWTEDRFEVSRGRDSIQAVVFGVTPGFFQQESYEVENGRAIGDLDVRDRLRVAVIGTAVAGRCFPRGPEAIGSWIRIKEEPFRVVGVLRHYERMYGDTNFLQEKNEVVCVPRTTAQMVLRASDAVESIVVDAADVTEVPLLAQVALNAVVQARGGLRDVTTQSNLEFFEQWQGIQLSFLAAGAAVGAVSLLVGGIGIMNLMMAAVNERIREVGLRKAIGAWPRDIFTQFVVEAITLSGLGGVAGLLLAWAVIDFLATHVSMDAPPLFSPGVATIGFGFSVFMGLVAGMYPAIRAARMDPVEALRCE
jgi:ABC-type antimicrobial peptide transport system, permease component